MTPPALPPDPPKSVTVTDWGTPHGSLWSIAEDLFEDGTEWRDINAENRAAIGADPDRLRVGMQLRLPPMELHPAYIRSIAKLLDTESKDVTSKLAAAQNRLNGIGNFWGTDSIGTKFYTGADGKPGIEKTSTQGAAGAEAFADLYRVISLGLRDMADRPAHTEWENKAIALAASVAPPGK